MTRRAPRGFTLLEIMVVVAIIGILTSLAVMGMSEFLAVAKTNGEGDALGGVLKTARLRALASGCAFVVRYRGYHYTLAPQGIGEAVVFRKGGCRLSTYSDMIFQPTAGDHVTESYQVTPNMPTSMNYPAPNTTMDDKSIDIGFDPSGTVLFGSDNGSTCAAVFLTAITVNSPKNPAYTRVLTFDGSGNVQVK